MLGLMLDMPLSIARLLEHAASVHGERELVSCPADEPVHCSTYAQAAIRARRLATALQRLGAGMGDRVATLAWSTHRHLEVIYAASGMGAVCHTVNPRLAPEQIAWMLDHADDRVVFVDLSFMPVLATVLPHVRCVRHVVIMTDRARMPSCGTGALATARCYEDLLDEQH
ncbi:MAG TPA: AMP-binding protein, partial [Rhodospirillales bacterium]|nr:AMP-binding protein [Rhodospirillales bacterium]